MTQNLLQKTFSKYNSSYKLGLTDVCIQFSLTGLSYYLINYFKNSYICLLFIIFLGLLNIKTFIIFHDCGHNSYTPNNKLNYIIGVICGILINFPFSWNNRHHTHHLTNGSVDNSYKFPFNELVFHTVDQYNNMPYIIRKIYKFGRHPFIFTTILTYFQFLIVERISCLIFLIKKHPNAKNIFMLFVEQIINDSFVALKFYVCYNNSILLHILGSLSITYTLGSIVLMNQHTFNPPYVVENKDWNFISSGLDGSSFIQVPYYLKYFTSNVEYHHIHHINSKIPHYHLEKCHNDISKESNLLDNVVKLSLYDCYQNIWLVLYDTKNNKYCKI